MSLLNLAVFSEDTELKTIGSPIYPLQGTDLYFCVPRVGGFEYQKQIRDIIKRRHGLFKEHIDIDMNEIHAIWLGEYVSDFGGALDTKTGKGLPFSRDNCRGIFNHKGYEESLVPILMNKGSSFENYLTVEGREAIEELKKL